MRTYAQLNIVAAWRTNKLLAGILSPASYILEMGHLHREAEMSGSPDSGGPSTCLYLSQEHYGFIRSADLHDQLISARGAPQDLSIGCLLNRKHDESLYHVNTRAHFRKACHGSLVFSWSWTSSSEDRPEWLE
ncbi:hypothetical protein GGR58DRAFT_498200 [Xylaria digitata]|nr:hypothetical protein GGR58DRAFT_498200 [Xylaria digitata]